MPESAASRLDYGDEVNRQLAAGSSPAAIAVAGSVSPQVVSKAAWLARTYDAKARGELGDAALEAVSASHLEVVATLDPAARLDLLRRSADGRLSVRQLRQLAGFAASRPEAPTGAVPEPAVKVTGTAIELANASAAVLRYATWDDRALGHLLCGPNGAVLRDLALAGRELAARIEGVMPAVLPLAVAALRPVHLPHLLHHPIPTS